MILRRRVILLVLAMALYACAAPVTEQERTGFISDYSSLEKMADNAYRYSSPAAKNFSRFIIDEPYILFEQAVTEDERQVSEQEIEELKVHFREQLEKALTEDGAYEVVALSGPRVARLRIGITALDATHGALNATIYAKVTGAGLGGAAIEGELVDFVTGERNAAESRMNCCATYTRRSRSTDSKSRFCSA